MNQNLSSYQFFYTVANTGNISKAAKELYISQPAISKSIQKLEGKRRLPSLFPQFPRRGINRRGTAALRACQDCL